ncbi:ATP-binding protein [Arthrobacter sp. ISL-72]|uniref:sensor histidine kinase n=1 Tax=Arthrobacter sp. ISL-72 TaxID=2819114 RepID=UPI001BECA9FB|nr:ATP-binding protein [Arthrobacter sp. ISL-72]MBT2594545.1 HAMP domain-containing protein [Arthrobacter sp. ISL-72]
MRLPVSKAANARASTRARLAALWSGLHSVRFQVLAAMLGMMFAGLALSGTITFAISFNELESRVDQGLTDRARNVERLARASSADSAQPFAYRLRAAAADVEPGRHGVLALFVDGHLAWKVEGNPDNQVLPETLYRPIAAMSDPRAQVTGSVGADPDQIRITLLPVEVSGGSGTAFLVAGRDISDQQERILASIRTYAMVSGGALVVAGLVGGFLAGHLLRPLRRMRETTEIVSHVDLSQRVDVRGGASDVSQLARTFNTMLERIDDGVNEQRQFMDDVAHELLTPLTILCGHLELMSPSDPEDVAETRALLLDELARLQRLVDDLLLLGNARRPNFVSVQELDVARFTDEVMGKIRVLANRRWEIDEACGGVAVADPQLLTQALVQLAANAVKYTDDDGVIALGSRVEPGQPNEDGLPEYDTLAVWVRDTGQGIAAEDQVRIFSRFARVEAGRGAEGSGLGLAIVTAIAEAHGGKVTVTSALGQGSTFTVLIPLSQDRALL